MYIVFSVVATDEAVLVIPEFKKGNYTPLDES